MLSPFDVERLVKLDAIFDEIFADKLHKKRKQSLAYCALGVLSSESLFLHEIGLKLSNIRGTNKKHATKQIDRLLSNPGIDI
ncbi:MAG: hypothetical protein AB7F64_07410 [Gammaproteobacteria bacterium]